MTANESKTMTINIEFVTCPRCGYEFCQHSKEETHEQEYWYCGYCGHSVDKKLDQDGRAVLQERTVDSEALNSQTRTEGLSYRYDIPESFGAYGIIWDRRKYNDSSLKQAVIAPLLRTVHGSGGENLYTLFFADNSFTGERGILTRKLSEQEIMSIDEKLRESGCFGYVNVWDEKMGEVTLVAGNFETFFSIVDADAVTGSNQSQ